MDDLAKQLSLTSQEHPAGRVDLTSTTSYLNEHRRRGFSDSDISDLFHENTKFDRQYLARSATTEDDLYERFSVVEHDYHRHNSIALPDPEPIECDLATVLDRRRSRRSFANQGISCQTVGTLLGHTVSPSDKADAGNFPETFRPYPSAGGLYPIEVYLVVREGTDISPGTYYYSPRDHALRVLTSGRPETTFTNCFMHEPFARGIVADAPVTVVLTGSLSRIKSKYGPVGYRFALFEAGHLAQNLLLVLSSLGLSGVPLGSFLDDELDQFLGIDGMNEAALYPIALGYPRDDD